MSWYLVVCLVLIDTLNSPPLPNCEACCYSPNQICVALDDATWDLRGSSASEKGNIQVSAESVRIACYAAQQPGGEDSSVSGCEDTVKAT